MDEKKNPFLAKLGPSLDIVNVSAQESMSSFNQFGGKTIVVVDLDGSHWRGVLVGYNFMYVEINRADGRMKIPCGNIDKILTEVEDAPEQK